MNKDANDIRFLRKSILLEACKAMGFRPGSWQQRLFEAFFWLPAQRFAYSAVEYDRQIDRFGLNISMSSLLPRLANYIEVKGADQIPLEGPLMIVSNHPGAFDGIVIISQLPRNDIKLIISDVPFTRGMKSASQYLIYSTGENMQERMSAVRQSIRHLRTGGVLMLFPTGVVDPDPSFMPGAEEALVNWSTSLEFLLRQVPDTCIVPTIVSGVIGPKFYNNYFARQQKTVRSRQKVAEYFEIAYLMVFNKDLGLSPRVSFGCPLSPAELGADQNNGKTVMDIILDRTRDLLNEHIRRI
jgi:hypothetical protein